MTDRDSVEFARLFTLLSETFNKAVSDSLAEIYFRTLKDFTIEQITHAVEQAIATKKFFPKPAELRELLVGNPEDRASNAWAAFLEAAANGGTASVQFADRATAMAMDATFGSWLEACRLLSAGGTDARGKQVGGCTDEMLASYQKSFLRHYGASLNSNREVELYRAGLSEASMREQGANWAARMPILEQPVLFVGPDETIELRLTFDVARGQLTEESCAYLGGGFESARLNAEKLYQLRAMGERPALPLSEVEMATPEEVTELKGNIMKIATRTLVVVALLALSVPAQINPLHGRFRKEYRVSAIATVQAHLKRHKGCELADVVPTLENMQIFFPPGMPVNHQAQAFPTVGATYPLVFVNDGLKWDERAAVVLLIHEAAHLTRRKGKWLCAADRQGAGRAAPCRLFGETQQDSDDITRDIEAHLEDELENLKKLELAKEN